MIATVMLMTSYTNDLIATTEKHLKVINIANLSSIQLASKTVTNIAGAMILD